MSAEERQFVNQISAMGFPVARVARAVKNLGCKEREVGRYFTFCLLSFSLIGERISKQSIAQWTIPAID
jgi:hypothetical protein